MATVLIAEDDPFNRDILCDLLESEGHTVVMAASAQAAVDAAASHQPALALLDMQMPLSDATPETDDAAGLWVLEKIRARPASATLPVIVLSGYSAADLGQQIAHLEHCAVGAKPYDFAGLLDTIDTMLAAS